MGSWNYITLEDCFEFIRNGANIKQEKGAGGIPITRIETLSRGVFNRDRLGYANIESTAKYSSYILESGDLLFSHINSKVYIGRTVLYEKEGDEVIIHGMNLLRMKVNPAVVIPKFIFYSFRSEDFKRQVASYRKDAVNQSSISVSDLKKIMIRVPSLTDQQRIVAELDLLSGIIEKKKAQLKTLDKLEESLFHESFGNLVTNDRNWDRGTLESLVVDKKQILRAAKHISADEIIHYIDISSIDNVAHKMTSTTDLIFSDAPSRAQQIVQSGDVLVSMVRPNLRNIAIVCSAENNLVASSGFCVLRSSSANHEFIRQLVLSEAFTDYLLTKVSGANYPAVREEDIKDCQIGIPPIEMQQQFSEKISAVEAEKQTIEASLSTAEQLLASRMDHWFSQE